MSVVTITKDNFDQQVMQAEKPVLVDFWASWCGPCRMVSPLVDEIAEENPQFVVGKVNVDDQPELTKAFGVMTIPTLVAFNGGVELGRRVGAVPKEEILKLLK